MKHKFNINDNVIIRDEITRGRRCLYNGEIGRIVNIQESAQSITYDVEIKRKYIAAEQWRFLECELEYTRNALQRLKERYEKA